QVGSAVTLYNAPATRFVAEFIGRMNVVRLAPQDGGPALAGQPIRIDGAANGSAQATLIGVRPEEIAIAPAGSVGENAVPGRVERTVFLGNVTRLTVEVADQQLLVEMP